VQGRSTVINLFSAGRTRTPQTTSDVLQALAVALKPLVAEREALLAERTLTALERERRLREVARRSREAGLDEFHRLIEKVCRGYCSRYPQQAAGRFEVEDFVTEVMALTFSQLVNFEPQVARFSTWFSSCILPRVYSDMQRRINPSWGRPQPKTAEGQRARLEVLNIVRNISLDQPTAISDQPFAERVADRQPSSETQILESQCQEYFLAAVAQLGEAERVLLRRVYVLQEAQKDIAASLGITPAAISLRLKKTYSRLAALLGEPFEAECADTQFCEALKRIP